jgi:hypothetical protein
MGYRSKNIVGKKYFTNKDMLAGSIRVNLEEMNTNNENVPERKRQSNG